MPPSDGEHDEAVSTMSTCTSDSDDDTKLPLIDFDSVVDYRLHVDRLKRDVDGMLGSNDDWELYWQKKDMSVRRRPSSCTGGYVFKMECLVELPVRDFSHRLHPLGPYRQHWDTMLEGVDVIKNIEPGTVLLRHRTKAQLMGLISKRDTVDLCCFVDNGHFRRVCILGIDYPHLKNYVRMSTYPTGLDIEETTNANISKVTIIMHANLHLQMLPLSLVESIYPQRMQLFMNDLKKAALMAPVVMPSDELPGWP